MGAMIYAKQPLSDDALVMLPGVKIGDSDTKEEEEENEQEESGIRE